MFTMANILAGRPREKRLEGIRIDGELTLGNILAYLSLRVISSAQRHEHVLDVEV
jgi:hypothetical protein